MAKQMAATDIVTPPVRVAFPALFEPRPVAQGSEVLKYMVTLLIPPDVDLAPFYAAIKQAYTDRFGNAAVKMPAKNNPLKDCAEKDLAGYEEGWHFINVKSQQQPAVVDQACRPVLDDKLIYSGCWVRAHINAFAYDHPQGGRGVSFGLNAVQLVRQDSRLDGRRDASEVFTPIELPEGESAAETATTVDPADDIFG